MLGCSSFSSSSASKPQVKSEIQGKKRLKTRKRWNKPPTFEYTPRCRWNQWILRLLQDLKKWETEKSLWKIWDFEEKSDRKFLNHETKSEQNKSKILNFYFKLIRFRLFRVPFQKDETTWSWAEKSQEMTQVSFTFRVGGPSTRGLRNPPPPPQFQGSSDVDGAPKLANSTKSVALQLQQPIPEIFFGKKDVKKVIGKFGMQLLFICCGSWQKGDRPDNDLRWAMQHSDNKKKSFLGEKN